MFGGGKKKLEITDEPVKVYNFKVDDFILIMSAIMEYWYIMQIIVRE